MARLFSVQFTGADQQFALVVGDHILPTQQRLCEDHRVGVGVIAIAMIIGRVLGIDPGRAAGDRQVWQQVGTALRFLFCRGQLLGLCGGELHVVGQCLLVQVVQVICRYLGGRAGECQPIQRHEQRGGVEMQTWNTQGVCSTERFID